MAEDLTEKAFRIALSTLSTSGLSTREEVEGVVDFAIKLAQQPDVDEVIDRDRIMWQIQSALDIYQPESLELKDTSGHVQWLGEDRRSEIDWAFNERYLRYLRERESRPPKILDRLDRTTLKILGHLGDPARKQESWDRRGLVVGGVQSGKTGNILGLICRAADAGYLLIVVLAGMHNNLRSQTQLRIDEGFLGFDTQVRQEIVNAEAGSAPHGTIGVGTLPGVRKLPVASLTTSAEVGDFLTERAQQQLVQLGLFPVVLVVKKHAISARQKPDGTFKPAGGILNNLTKWILDTAGQGEPGEAKKVRAFPLLVIDDEADSGSINTKYASRNAGPDDEVTPTAVNSAIRSLLNAFERSSYVGYTATPNANIYIPPDVDNAEFGRDLFPEHFVEYILPPSNYFGPARVFGAEDFGDEDPEEGKADNGLIRVITDHTAWLPDKHKKGTQPGRLPDSLRTAIRSFVLARAVRLARGQRHKHNSMLVHASQWQDVQESVRDQIRDELDDLRGRIRFDDSGEIQAELKKLFEEDFQPTTQSWKTAEPVTLVDWAEVEQQLEEAVTPIELMVINGKSDDALAYFERRWEGLNVIAVGGNKLSRGLTLEGLTVSYYLRAASTHDTLLQMGRWFGYRDGYEDACRLYTTSTLVEAFRGVTEANLELISEFEEMAQIGEKPRKYGLKIQDTVADMLVTARNRMPGAKTLRIGFSGQGPSTVVMYCDRDRASANLAATRNLIRKMDENGYSRTGRDGDTQIWTGVDGLMLASTFFEKYSSPASAWRVQGPAIAKYIKNRVAAGELTDWTVALLSSNEAKREFDRRTIAGYSVGLTKRTVFLSDRLADGHYSIKQLLSPSHETLDLSKAEKEAALELTWQQYEASDKKGRWKNPPTKPGGMAIRATRPKEKGLLLIYPLAPPVVPADTVMNKEIATEPIIGFFVSFPKSPKAPAVDYVVNRVYLEEFYSDTDFDEDLEG
ncbi:MAG: Z1 domain-containing protein [Candidatus Nanopelagicales bacterium]